MVNESGEKISYKVLTRDICSGGAFFLSNNAPAVGTGVKMNLVLAIKKNSFSKEEKKSRIDVAGKVVRTNKYGMAVCFDKKYKIIPFRS